MYLEAGTLTLRPTLDQRGYLVPLNALQDGVRGLWTVLTLQSGEGSETFIVGREAVEILHIEGDQAFVRGTFEGDISIIGDGTHRVVPGAQVRLAEPLDERGEG